MRKQGPRKLKNRDNEKGAAMIMALLVSFLLLVASAGLLMESSMNTNNVTDATAEQQAYNAAESGIQSAVFVLRDNVTLADADRLDTTQAATHKKNRTNFVRALTLASSNKAGDVATAPRLSRWLNYSTTQTDRVVVGSGAESLAYSLTISDPDNTGKTVTFSTDGRLTDSDCGITCTTSDPLRFQKTYPSYPAGPNSVVIRYTPKSATTLDTTPGNAATNFGTFSVTVNGTGALIPAFNRFEIYTTMTVPYDANRTIRGYIETNTCGTCAPKVIFDAQSHTLQGSQLDLAFAWGSPTNQTIVGPPQRWGYEANMSVGSNNIITGTISSPEPKRLLIKSTGFGPRGSRKQLEAVIQKDFFDGLGAPATLTLIGPPSTTSPATTFTFNPGSSAVTVYTGVDAASTDIIPPIGTSNDTNLEDVQGSVDGQPPHPFNGSVIGAPSNISFETPPYLRSPFALDAAVRSLYNVANASGRYFPSGQQPTTFGNNTTATGITFCDGNCEFTGSGGGIMVVTGTLTLRGNFSFNGLILVTGQGGVTRSGGGNGTIQGNMVIAPYQYSQISDNQSPTTASTFLAPQYDLSGGGNSTIQYNSNSVAGGLIAVSNFVLGVAEK